MKYEQFRERYSYNPQKDLLGSGTYGKVYLATDIASKPNRFVAIKTSPVRPKEQYNLKQEVELVSQKLTKNHPNIAYYEQPCYRYITDMGPYDFAILEYYPEGNLKQLLGKYSLTLAQKEDIANQILDGICFYHAANVIHRDLKPSNILLQTNAAGRLIPKIADFGISKTATWEQTHFTNTRISGTLSFAAPEQMKAGKLYQNADLWAYGVLLYDLFLGEYPYNVNDLEELSKLQQGHFAPRMAELPEPFQEIVKQCLVVDPQQRVQKAEFLKTLLEGDIVIESESVQPNPIRVPANQQLPPLSQQLSSMSPKKENGFTQSNLLILCVGLVAMSLGIFQYLNQKKIPKKEPIETIETKVISVDPFAKVRSEMTAKGYTCYDPKDEMMRFYNPKDQKQSFVYKDGSPIGVKFDMADDFKNDEAYVFVKKGTDKNGKSVGKYFYIDKTGQCIRDCN